MNFGIHGGNNGFDLSEFTEMLSQLEQLGEDIDIIAEQVLNAGSEPARQAFIKNTPLSDEEKEHARDNIVVSKTRTARKSKNKYRLIGALDRKFEYLYYVENGTVRAPAKPFIEKAYREAQAAASEPMRQAFIQEFEKRMGG